MCLPAAKIPALWHCIGLHIRLHLHVDVGVHAGFKSRYGERNFEKKRKIAIRLRREPSVVCSDQCELCCGACCWYSEMQTGMRRKIIKKKNMRKCNVSTQQKKHQHTHKSARPATHAPSRMPTHTPARTRPHPYPRLDTPAPARPFPRAHVHPPTPHTPAGAHVRRLVFVFVLFWFSIFEIGTYVRCSFEFLLVFSF